MPDNRKGTGIQANPPQNPQEKIAKRGAKRGGESGGKSAGVNGGGNEQKDIEKEDEDDWDVPSQADFFRSIRERLGLDKQKGGTSLSAVV